MKFNYKLNLGNLVGAAINAVPEIQDKVNPKDFNDITIEGSAEYTISEAVAMIEESKKLLVELPDILAVVAIKMKNTYDIIEELDAEEDEIAGAIEEIIATCNKAQDENRELRNKLTTAENAVDYLKEKNKELKDKVYGTRRKKFIKA